MQILQLVHENETHTSTVCRHGMTCMSACPPAHTVVRADGRMRKLGERRDHLQDKDCSSRVRMSRCY